MQPRQERLAPAKDFEPFEIGEIHQGIHQRFEKQAKKHGSRRAITDPEGTLTYEALNSAANNIARALKSRCGNGSGQVAFVLENKAYAIATLLGILKSGRAYVPLDPSFPKDRTAYMFEHSQSRLIITDHSHEKLAGEIGGDGAPILLIDNIDLTQAAGDEELAP